MRPRSALRMRSRGSPLRSPQSSFFVRDRETAKYKEGEDEQFDVSPALEEALPW